MIANCMVRDCVCSCCDVGFDIILGPTATKRMRCERVGLVVKEGGHVTGVYVKAKCTTGIEYRAKKSGSASQCEVWGGGPPIPVVNYRIICDCGAHLASVATDYAILEIENGCVWAFGHVAHAGCDRPHRRFPTIIDYAAVVNECILLKLAELAE